MTLIPAYGRDYQSVKALKADWDAGKDFMICDMSSPDDGRYMNKAQAKKGETFMVRYANKRKQTAIKG